MNLSSNWLWLLIAVFAATSLVDVFHPLLLFTVLQLILMVAFAFGHGALRYGARGIAAFAVICLVVSTLLENLGVASGFPFGRYYYTDGLGPKLFYVPLLIAPAYLAVGYMAWVLATILVGDVKRGAGALSTFATPFIAAFIMVMWDLVLDPTASTVEKNWIWEQGGGFFGVPFSNYLGWFLTVYAFMQLFALYLRGSSHAAAVNLPRSYFVQGILMYAIVAVRFILAYLVYPSENVTDPAGVAWRTGDIYETAALTATFTMLFVVALAAILLARQPDAPQGR
jgi:putative membrane protein